MDQKGRSPRNAIWPECGGSSAAPATESEGAFAGQAVAWPIERVRADAF